MGGWSGVMQLWALPAHIRPPMEKRRLMATTQGQPFEKRSWEKGPEGRRLVCMQSVGNDK